MVRRTARRGSNAGSDFWGCSEFPRCRGVVAYEPTVEAPVGEGSVVVAAADEDQGGVEEATTPDADGKRDGFLMKVARTVDKGWRWYLESDEPDAAGRWDDAHRRRMRSYVYDRDGGRCGLCTAEMKIKGAQIEHVVPKVFVLFDVGKNGKAEPGTQYKSRLHKIDNLQAAHTYCKPTPIATSARATPRRSTSGDTRPCRRSPSRTPKTEERSCCPGSRRLDQRANAWEPSAQSALPERVGRCGAMARESDKGVITPAVCRGGDGSGVFATILGRSRTQREDESVVV